MNGLQIWLEQNFVLFLSVAFTLSLLVLVFGAMGAWRLGRRLGRPPRPFIRFVLALVAVAAGLRGVLLFSDGLITVVPAARAQNRMLGRPAPSLDFAYVEDGRGGGLADFSGQVILLNIWATWCPPCREEMPHLEELQRIHAADGLVVLQVSDEDRETVAAYLDEHPMTTIHGVAQPIPWPEFGRPTTFILDREGVVRRAIVGPRDLEGFEREIQDYL